MAVEAVLVTLFAVVNALTAMRDLTPGGDVASWEPWVWETSSAVVTFCLAPLIWLLLISDPPCRSRWLRFAAIHIVGSLVFSVAHVAAFTAIRLLVYRTLGFDYAYGSLDDFIYEYRKDALTYGLTLGFMWMALNQFTIRAASAKAAAAPTFDIRDGARLLRVSTAEIVAVTAAGNYVEFRLTDGRRPLMRATLAATEAGLAPHGFVRSHRSWLINPDGVRAITPEGSGDFRLTLEGGAEAPLSRRFPAALERLRRPGAPAQGVAGAA